MPTKRTRAKSQQPKPRQQQPRGKKVRTRAAQVRAKKPPKAKPTARAVVARKTRPVSPPKTKRRTSVQPTSAKRKPSAKQANAPNVWRPKWQSSDTKYTLRPMASQLANDGFKLFLQGMKRTSAPMLVRCQGSVISEVGPRDVKNTLLAELDTHPTCAPSAKEIAVRLTDAEIGRIADQLPILAQSEMRDVDLFVPFRDEPQEARFFFSNGVVVVTPESIALKPTSAFADDGFIWEHDIKLRSITILKPPQAKGLFEQFYEKAFRRRVRTNGARWEDDFELDASGEAHYKAFRACLGYLLHSYRDPANPRAIIFVDAASDETQAQGGTGKSLAVRALHHLRSVSSQDGKRFADNMAGGGRFQFSNVGPDTKIVLIDDVRPNFQFEHLFNMLSGDMEVEQKGKNKTVIPHDRAPKFAVTTNYVLPQSGVSFTRRQYLVEFGSYWSTALQAGELTTDAKHLGKNLFDTNFTPDDWNEFYNYLFGCVQQYLREGVIVGPTQALAARALRRELGDSFVDYFEAYFENYEKRNVNPSKGEFLDDLLKQFHGAYPDATLTSQSFQTRLMSLGKHFGWEYNAHKVAKGTTPTHRRWRVTDNATPPNKRDAVFFSRIARGNVSQCPSVVNHTNVRSAANGGRLTEPPTKRPPLRVSVVSAVSAAIADLLIRKKLG